MNISALAKLLWQNIRRILKFLSKCYFLGLNKISKATKGNIAAGIIAFLMLYYVLPNPLFDKPPSPVLFAKDGQLLAARVAKDGQYRFTQNTPVPFKFKACALTFEDQYFYIHPGINPSSVIRALIINIKSRKIVQGASTISMQVARLALEMEERSRFNKFTEAIATIIIEIQYSKDEILALYAHNAPFGGNVVGLETAAWRFFQTSAENLSWGQTAALAVLPNAPAYIYPGKNENLLRKKRDFLLQKLHNRGFIDSTQLQLAILEPLPSPAKLLPRYAPHLIDHALNENPNCTYIQSTIDYNLQLLSENVIQAHAERLSANRIHNAAALIAHIPSATVRAYIANIPGLDNKNNGFVNNITSNRSCGSLLKPFLYAAMMDQGLLLPTQLLPDLPVDYAGFKPQNSTLTFYGAVPANDALRASLNIPFVTLLKDYGIDNFLTIMRKWGITTFNHNAEHYGLALILGAPEASLYELTAAYASMARSLLVDSTDKTKTLIHETLSSNYPPSVIPLSYRLNELENSNALQNARAHPTPAPTSNGANYITIKELQAIERPEPGKGWKAYHSTATRPVAWKTGTSYGNRDAWAIGITGEYAIGVWVGNSTGRGQAGNAGHEQAGAILFDLVRNIPEQKQYKRPIHATQIRSVCKKTGHPPAQCCKERTDIITLKGPSLVEPCPYHKTVYTNKEQTHQVNPKDYHYAQIRDTVYFILPPRQAFYYKKFNPDYRTPPPFVNNEKHNQNIKLLQFIYPHSNNALLAVTRGTDALPQPITFKATHADPTATLHWHLDDSYLGATKEPHEMPITPSIGKHQMRIIDPAGNEETVSFSVIP